MLKLLNRRTEGKMDNYRIRINGMNILFQKWPKKKLPVLAVQFEGEADMYKVASFDSEEKMDWFIEVFKEACEAEDYGLYKQS